MKKISEIFTGTPLTEVIKTIKQENVNLYALASGDNNPIHLDPEFGKKMQLGGTVAHGMIVLAYVSEFMTINFGKSWISGGNLDVRFKEPARPGDTLIVKGNVSDVIKNEEQVRIKCDVTCSNQNNQVIITGETEAILS